MPTERVNEKDEAAVVRAALEDGSRQRWGAASTDTASYFAMSRTALAALDRIITQRDQALADVERLRGERDYWMAKQHEYATDVRNVRIERDMALDEEARSQAEWRRLGAEVERLRTALEEMLESYDLMMADAVKGTVHEQVARGYFLKAPDRARQALADNTRETAP